jgi:hypothetical protein
MEIADDPMTELLKDKYLLVTNKTHNACNVTTVMAQK